MVSPIKKRHRCLAGRGAVLVRNVAARGLRRTFVLRLAPPVTGLVRVRHGMLPFFLGATSSEEPLTDGMQVLRRFFDASFELVVLADADVDVTVS